jgi:Tol biopolymer transport system component
VKPLRPSYAFGPFVLDTQRGLLFEDGAPVPLTPRVFELLSTLVQHEGELLTKDDLMKLVWAGTVVEENNLARQVSTLRKILHEHPGYHEYIVTVPGAGYRFVAPVSEVAVRPSAPAAAPLASPPPPSPPPHSGRRSMLAAALSATAALVLFVTWNLGKSPRQLAPQRSLWQLTFGTGLQQDPAWSPDGKRVAFASDREGNLDIWVQALGDAEPTRLTSSPARDSEPDWSPDGQWIAFRSDRDGGGVFIVRADGGPETRVASFGSRPRWSPSGASILFASAEPGSAGALRMYLVSRDGGAPRLVQHEALAGVNITSANWRPDGALSVWGRDEAHKWTFVTIPLEGGSTARATIPDVVRDRLDSGQLALSSFVWAKSRAFLYFEGRAQAVHNIWRVGVAPDSTNWIEDPERLTTGPGADESLALSPDGDRLAFAITSGRTHTWSFGFDPVHGTITSAGEALTTGDREERSADAWADGSKLVFLASRNDRQELWERASNAQPRLLVSATQWSHSPPRWSPDGTRVAYQRSRRMPAQPDRAVAVMAVEAQQEQLVTALGDKELIPSDWSSDAVSILGACRLRPEDLLGTCVLPMSGTAIDRSPRRISSDERVDMMQQRFSPNQRWVSFTAVPAADRSVSTVYLMPAAGGQWTPVTDGSWYDDKPRWAPDGRALYFISNRDGWPEVWGRHIDPVAGQPQGGLFRVTSFAESRQLLSPSLAQMELSVSAKRIFLPMYEASGQVWILDGVAR